MIKNKSIKKSSIYKGLSLAFAGVFAASLIPVNVIETKADYQIGGIGSESISVYNTENTASKGGRYEIRAAYFGSESQIPVGLSSEGYSSDYASVSYDGTHTISNIVSNVTVTYLASGEEVETQQNSDKTITGAAKDAAVWGTFEVAHAGEYKVTYSMSFDVNGATKSYETSTIVYGQVSSAYFEFDDNAENVIPSVYDVKMQSECKNIDLPLPKVFGEDEKEIENVKFVTSDPADATDYVKITVSSGNGLVAVDESNGNFYIDAKYLNPEDTENFKGEGNYIVKYAYYEGGQFIKSITKTFSVSKEYYKDYSLDLSRNGSLSSAITGVASTLPTLTGKTGSKSTPASENVNIHYTVKAYRQTTGGYTEEREGSIEDGKFTPWEDGNYKIVYTATDFYGNTATSEFFIDSVKDTQRPVAKIYDASNKKNYVDEDYAKGINEYIDASSALKSVTGEKNIIIYAVGATDNVSEGLKYTRLVKYSSTVIEIKDYADYNLIFDFDADSFLANNHYFTSMHSDVNTGNLTEWLKANKFLIVTNDSEKTVEDGYAYIDANNLKLEGTADGKTYTAVYYAEDAAGNTSEELTYSIKVMSNSEGYNDTIDPEITFVTNLKNSYRTNSVISFEKPTASDEDTRMDVIVEYKYDVDSNWRTFEDEKYEIDLSEVEELIKAGKTPKTVTIYAHAVDDYGNVGEWEKEIDIVDVKDERAPTIISEKYNTENTNKIEQNTEIVLPTIKLNDDNVKYLNSQVYVTRIGENEKSIEVYGKSETRDILSKTYTLNAGKIVASYPGKYQVKVVFTDAGNNQITTFYNFEVEGKAIVEAPTITGIGTTLGNSGVGEVGEAVNLETPSIDYAINTETHAVFGIKNDDSKAATKFDVKVVNEAPSNYLFNENEENTFTAYETGTYKLQYFVKFSVFNKEKFEVNGDNTAVVVKDTTDVVYPLENGDFMIVGTSVVKYAVKGENGYTVYDLSSKFTSDARGIKLSETNYYLEIGAQAKLVAPNGAEAENFGVTGDKFSVNGSQDVTAEATGYALDDFTAYRIPSQVLTIEVKDTKAPVMSGDYDYPVTANVNDFITIRKVEATDASASGIDLEKSYVLVSVKGGATSYSKQYYLNKWQDKDNTYDAAGNIQYKVTNDGTCTITYYIYDHAGNLNSDCTYTIAVGDTEIPKVTIAENFIKESYSLSEFSESNPLVLDFSKLTFSDNKTSAEDLKETVKIVVKNTTTGNEVANTGDADANIYRYVPTEVGTYEITVVVTDEAGWESTSGKVTFEVKAESNDGTEVYEVVGTVLIVVAVAILAGVVTYFVVSAVKHNKKNGKGKAKKADK